MVLALVHVFGLTRGKMNDITNFEGFMLNCSHKTSKPQVDCTIQCNFKLVRVYSIEIRDSMEKKFLVDISPFNHGQGELRDKLKLFADSFRNQFGLKYDGGGVGKRQTTNPSQRDYINIFMLGYKRGGKKMKKYYVLIESQRKYTDQFIEWLENKTYPTMLPNNPSFVVKPIIKELRMFDITTFETCTGKLFLDMKPFYAVTDFMENWKKRIYLFGLSLFGLRKPQGTMLGNSPTPFDRSNLGVVILAEKDDVKLVDPSNPNVISEMV